MKIQSLAPAFVALTICSASTAVRSANASPVFGATATITNPPDISKSPTHQPKIDHTPAGATFVSETLKATNVVVTVTGGTKNGSMSVQYAMSLNENTNQVICDTNANDPYQVIHLDKDGNFSRGAFQSKTGDISAAVNLPANTSGGSSYSYTIDAIADIYDLANISQKNHADSSGAIAVSNPGQ